MDSEKEFGNKYPPTRDRSAKIDRSTPFNFYYMIGDWPSQNSFDIFPGQFAFEILILPAGSAEGERRSPAHNDGNPVYQKDRSCRKAVNGIRCYFLSPECCLLAPRGVCEELLCFFFCPFGVRLLVPEVVSLGKNRNQNSQEYDACFHCLPLFDQDCIRVSICWQGERITVCVMKVLPPDAEKTTPLRMIYFYRSAAD